MLGPLDPSQNETPKKGSFGIPTLPVRDHKDYRGHDVLEIGRSRFTQSEERARGVLPLPCEEARWLLTPT